MQPQLVQAVRKAPLGAPLLLWHFYSSPIGTGQKPNKVALFMHSESEVTPYARSYLNSRIFLLTYPPLDFLNHTDLCQRFPT